MPIGRSVHDLMGWMEFSARVSVLVLVLVVFCWLPYHVMLVVHALPERRLGRLPSYAYYLSLVAILLNSLLSPFLYAYRSRRIQREVRRLFGMAPKSRRYDAVSNTSNAAAAAAAAKSLMKPASPRRQLMRKHVILSQCLYSMPFDGDRISKSSARSLTHTIHQFIHHLSSVGMESRSGTATSSPPKKCSRSSTRRCRWRRWRP